METEIQMMKAILQLLLKIRFHKRHNLPSPDRSGNPFLTPTEFRTLSELKKIATYGRNYLY
jgi:hypothetical protein